MRRIRSLSSLRDSVNYRFRHLRAGLSSEAPAGLRTIDEPAGLRRSGLNSWRIAPIFLVLFLLLAPGLFAADKPLAGYNTIVIQPFTVDPELTKAKFPADYENVLEKTLFANLLSAGVFETVTDASLDPEAAKAKTPHTVIASGEVVDYYRGNRAARVVINYGAGAARLKIVMVFRDAESGREVLRIEHEGSYAGFGNITGGSASKAQTESARKVVEGLMKKIKAAK
jgi:hypothetical protein